MQPEFLFLATDMAYGVSWVFSRGWMGDYQVGYMPPPADFAVARAVAASACFPPLFGPLRLRLDPAHLKGGTAPHDAAREECLSDLRLTDGGDYDNMGLEPVWKNHAVVLVSDAGGLFTHQSDRGPPLARPALSGHPGAAGPGAAQALAHGQPVRRARSTGRTGASAAPPATTTRGRAGYSKALARDVIAEIRTDLDAFTDAEAAVLENHGYLLADAALRRHVPALLRDPVPPAQVPHPDWFPPARGEEEIRGGLA